MYEREKLENLKKVNQSHTGENQGYVSFYPRYIQLEHTTYCNAECIMCNHFFLGNKGAETIDERVIAKIEPILPYCELIMVNGDGEPFMCRKLEKYLEMYSKYGVTVSTNTNLCACNEERLIAAMQFFDYLNISCDGITERTFGLIRKKLSFEKFMRNLSALREKCPDKRLNLDFVVMTHNLSEVPDAVSFAYDNGFSALHLNLMNPNPMIENQSDSILLYPEAAAYYFGKAAERAEKCGITLKAPFYLIHQPDSEKLKKELEELKFLDSGKILSERLSRIQSLKETRSLTSDHLSIKSEITDLVDNSFHAGRECAWGLERCYVDTKGNVTTCCFNVRHYMGNLLEADSFEDIWNGENYRRFRMQMAEGKLPEWCRGCTWFNGSCGKLEKGTQMPEQIRGKK